MGEVAGSLGDFRAGALLVTGGAGVRFALDPENRLNLRVDVGVSEFGVAPMVVAREAF